MKRYHRKIIRITAEQSPNVRFGLAQLRAGQEPTNEVLVPGVLSYRKYTERRRLWDLPKQTVSLDAMFYEGKEAKLYPTEWLVRSQREAVRLRGRSRVGKALGNDPAEGGDSTAMSAVDDLGLIELEVRKTPDTNVVPGFTIAFGQKHRVPPTHWMFDRGGGGKEHADRLRADGYPVRTVGFGEAPTVELHRGTKLFKERVEEREARGSFKNRRAQMYWYLRLLLEDGWAISGEYNELLRQMSLIPLTRDSEGRLYILPKRRKSANSTERSLEDVLGRSPDELDSLVVAVYCMLTKPLRLTAGVV